MIKKHFEIEKINLLNNYFFLFYGENEGLKNELIKKNFVNKFTESIYRYDESEILNNKNEFIVRLFSQSFFDNKKLIIISRVSEKIIDTVEEIIEKKITDIVIILLSNNLDKKSKLRSLFEKNKELICIPFYEDNSQTLASITGNFFRQKKIPISAQTINLLVDRARGDRLNLDGELKKIESFIYSKKKIVIEDILKLTNLAENYNISELVDNCLAKNKKKTVKILNENNFSMEDAIIVIRTFLNKSKRLLKLRKEFENNKNIDLAISSSKPPIFWKDKDIVRQQIQKWTEDSVIKLIQDTNDIELLIKKNSTSSINILSDFIIEQATASNNLI
jgi:DNA polymerase III subunit delta